MGTPADEDVLPIVDDSTTTTRKLSIADLLSFLTNMLIPNRTRIEPFWFKADGSGGAVEDISEGPAVAFTGTPTGYARGRLVVPMDYAGGDITIKVYARASATNTDETVTSYCGIHSPGDVHSSWNIFSGNAQTESFSTSYSTITIDQVIPEASITAGDVILAAIRVSTALTGTVYFVAMFIEYTAEY